MTKYETIEGTEPHPYVEHEPRVLERREDADLMMMTEIGDGVFIQWANCRRCSERVAGCKCQGGPVGPDWMKKYQDQRFERELATRPDPDYDLLPSVLEWVKERGYQLVEPGATASLMSAAQEAQDAAYGDSNDSEIDLLRDALEQSLALLGERLPEGRDSDEDEDDGEDYVYYCKGCGREELTCSKDPCPDVIADRGETEPDVDDERDHEETGPDGDARTYDPETGGKIEPEVPDAQPNEGYGDGDSDRLKGRQFDAGF